MPSRRETNSEFGARCKQTVHHAERDEYDVADGTRKATATGRKSEKVFKSVRKCSVAISGGGEMEAGGRRTGSPHPNPLPKGEVTENGGPLSMGKGQSVRLTNSRIEHAMQGKNKNRPRGWLLFRAFLSRF